MIEQAKSKITIGDLNPLQMKDLEIEFCHEEAFKLWRENRKLHDKAIKVQSQLGIGGLWRGSQASLLIIAEAIKEEN